MRCPICKKPVEITSALAPFCSERCRLIDLGNWASGRYVIPSPLSDSEMAQTMEERARERGGLPATPLMDGNSDEEG